MYTFIIVCHGSWVWDNHPSQQTGRRAGRQRDRFHPCAQTYAPKGAWFEPSHRISLASPFNFKLINSRPGKEIKKILSSSMCHAKCVRGNYLVTASFVHLLNIGPGKKGQAIYSQGNVNQPEKGMWCAPIAGVFTNNSKFRIGIPRRESWNNCSEAFSYLDNKSLATWLDLTQRPRSRSGSDLICTSQWCCCWWCCCGRSRSEVARSRRVGVCSLKEGGGAEV